MQGRIKRAEGQQTGLRQAHEPALAGSLQEERMQRCCRRQPQPEAMLQRGLDPLAGFRPVTRTACVGEERVEKEATPPDHDKLL